MSTAKAGLQYGLVRPPRGLKCLDHLAWCIGRDDKAQGRLPVRAAFYRPDKAKHYMAGYEAQSPNAALSESEARTERPQQEARERADDSLQQMARHCPEDSQQTKTQKPTT